MPATWGDAVSEGGSGLSGGEVAVLAGAAVLGVSGGVVWAGAALAAMASGHRLSGGLVDAVQAIQGLVERPGDPRSAWQRPQDRAVLPGPGLYWSATLLVVAMVGVVGWVGLRVWRGARGRGRVRLGVETRARFANAADLAPLVVESPVPSGRFVLGVANGRLLATEDRRAATTRRRGGRRRRFRQGDRGSVAVIGPSRSGKTVNVISSLLEWDGPAVVVSVKRDLIDATRRARSAIGETRVFDPSGVSGIPVRELARWSPLRAAGTASGAQKAAAALAAAIPKSGIEGGGDYWARQSEILLTGLLGAAALDPSLTMVDVAEWVFTNDLPVDGEPHPIVDLLERVEAEGSPEQRHAAGMAMLHLRAAWGSEERMRSIVFSTVQTVLQTWLDPTVGESARLRRAGRDRFVDLDWLTDPQRANTLYLVAPLDDQKRLAPVLGGLLGDLKNQAYERDVSGRALERTLLMVIDEAGNMPLAWLPEVASTCAGIGILLVTIWQSKAQLDAAYGRLADSVLTNHLTKVVFAGCSDQSTLEYVSRLLGDEEVERRSTSWDVNGTGRRSISESTQREALTPFHLLRQVRPGEAVLIHATLPPAHLHSRPYWFDPRLQQLADPAGDTSRIRANFRTGHIR